MSTEEMLPASFDEMDLSIEVLKAVKDMGFTNPSTVQAKTIPLMMSGADINAMAPTGTGKTCAFGIPLIECLNPDMKDLQALVLCPTRELCEQIAADLRALVRYNPAIRIASIYGGANMKNIQLDEKAMARTEAIILSMTPKERENPNILGASRKKRIAAGAGVRIEDVNRLLKSFDQMKSLIKQFSGPGAGKKMKRMRGFGGFGGFPGF